jgi:hypothetical protein
MIPKIFRSFLLIFTGLFLFNESSPAQFTRIGGGLSFSTGIENDDHKTGNPGLNARGVLELSEKFWVVPQLTFYMPGKRQHSTFGMSTTVFGTLDADVTYAMASEGAILFYALAGPNISFLSTSFKSGDFPAENKVMPALNIGTGIEMIIEKDINAFAQVKGVIGSYSQYLAINIGVHYYFSGRRYKTW